MTRKATNIAPPDTSGSPCGDGQLREDSRQPYSPTHWLVRIRPRNSTVYTSQARTVMATSPDGFVFRHKEHGLWFYQSRMLSRYRWLVNGEPPLMAANSNIQQHTWLGYYIASAPNIKNTGADEGNSAKQAIELRLSRYVGPGLHEDVDVTNFITAAIYFGVVVAGLWHWTGNKELVRPLVDTALKGLQWADQYGDIDGDGFCEYLTRSEQGVKNQGWKDSSDAIVYEDGSQVPDPLGTCEMQAFIYASKLHLSELLWWLGELEIAKKLFRQAEELRKRFNEAFWMEDETYFTMGLDAQKRQIKSVASDPGHCLASGIADETVAERVANRMLCEDMFSGWGVRTLSARHPAFSPYSYHRGTVWPVANAVFTLAFARYGLH